ncbi:MAG: L-threonylcarbamoyladenylate synthase [Gemmatimonadetes bacterium]|nr:L-threonylcarbamoyladenylate synthase [Gemmatimonadota bacterium]
MIGLPTLQNINQAADIIKNGGLIAYPTETVYGLGADPYNAEAIQKIFTAKGRAEDKGIILLIRGVDDLSTLVHTVSPTAQILIEVFWPGPLTLVFRANRDLSPALLGGRDTIALRHSSSSVASRLLFALGGPLTSTSANRSAEPPARSACEVENALGDHLDLILDGGPSDTTLPSTLVDVSSDRVILLREGAIPAQKLRTHIHIEK